MKKHNRSVCANAKPVQCRVLRATLWAIGALMLGTLRSLVAVDYTPTRSASPTIYKCSSDYLGKNGAGMFDNDKTTAGGRWLLNAKPTKDNPGYVIVDYGGPVAVVGYSLLPVYSAGTEAGNWYVPARNPRDFSLLGKNDNPDADDGWEVVDERNGVEIAETQTDKGCSWYKFYVSLPKAYRYWKFMITDNAGDNTYTALQELFLHTSTVSGKVHKYSSCASINGKTYDGAFDGDLTDSEGQWLVVGSSGYVVWDCSEAVVINKYAILPVNINAGNYENGGAGKYAEGRSPRDFQLLGTNGDPDSDAGWTLLDSQSGQEMGSSNNGEGWWQYEMGNATPYRYYKLNITANNGAADYTAVHEISFNGINRFFASPDGRDDAACTADDPGTIAAAFAKCASAANFNVGDRIVLKDGDYLFTAATAGDSAVWALKNDSVDYLTIQSESGNRDRCRLIGGGSTTPCGCIYTEKALRVQDLTITNYHCKTSGIALRNFNYRMEAINVAVVDCSDLANNGDGGAVRAHHDFYATNCLFKLCSAIGYSSGNGGGAVRLEAGRLGRFDDCTFVSNRLTCTDIRSFGGAGYYGTYVGCTFVDNGGDYARGGALYQAEVRDSTFIGNYGYIGGTLYNCNASNCTIENSRASNMCGATIGGTLTDCRISDVVSSGQWAVNFTKAVRCVFKNLQVASGPTVGVSCYNCVFDGAKTPTIGSAVLFRGGDNSALPLVNCTFVNNEYLTFGNAASTNCAFATSLDFDASGHVGAIVAADAAALRLKLSGDAPRCYSPSFGSPLVDAGVAVDVSGADMAFDLYGRARIAGAGIDVGAVEYTIDKSGLQIIVK